MLTVTDVTVIQPGWWGNVVFLDQPLAKRFLIFFGLVPHFKDLILRADILFRVPVTIQAPLHVKRVCLPGQRHLIHPPMAGFAAYSLGNMDAVVEINVVWQIIDSVPLDRLTSAKTFSDGFEYGALIPDLTMTGHTGLRRRNIGEGGFLYGHMTVAAVDAIVAHVMFVAERDRLLDGIIDPDGKRRTKQQSQGNPTTQHEQHSSNDADFGDGVHTAMKDLRHVTPPPWS
jgi:hypothetical protein